MYHQSVLLEESIEALNIKPSGIYIDGTFGLGGHSRLILSKLDKNGRLIAVDRDWQSVKVGRLIANKDKRFIMIHTSFSKLLKYIKKMKLTGLINGILLDLGICESQLFDLNRGFSFMRDGFLDMRMDLSAGQSAAQWLSIASQSKLEWVLRNFGEERFSKRIAQSIISQRRLKPILRSIELSNIISGAMPYYIKYKQHKHPATRSFLAIRIYINDELTEIKQMLEDSLTLLSPKGRLVVVSFNSLEDRLIKQFIVRYSSRFLPVLSKLALTDKQMLDTYLNRYQLRNIGKLVPSIQEIKQNTRARSAILRCAEKLVISKL